MAGVLTKEDFQELKVIFATKDDLKLFATKDDLKSFATKDDLRAMERRAGKRFATKDDLDRAIDVLEQKIDRSTRSLRIDFNRQFEELARLVAKALGHSPSSR